MPEEMYLLKPLFLSNTVLPVLSILLSEKAVVKIRRMEMFLCFH